MLNVLTELSLTQTLLPCTLCSSIWFSRALCLAQANHDVEKGMLEWLADQDVYADSEDCWGQRLFFFGCLHKLWC